MLINFYISLITKRFFRFFDRHSDKTATLIVLLQDINNFSKTIEDVIRKSKEFSFKIVRVITIIVSNSVNFLVNAPIRQSIDSGYSMTSRCSTILLLSPPSYILYTLTLLKTIYCSHAQAHILSGRAEQCVPGPRYSKLFTAPMRKLTLFW